jgi:cell division protein FtsA
MDAVALAALDLGSTRFRAVVAEPDGKGGVAILGHASLPARGMMRGQLNDLPAATAVIRDVLDQAAEEAGCEVERVAVGVGGDCVRSVSARGVVNLAPGGGGVRADHVEMARQRVSSVGIPFDRVILHCLPVEFVLDERSGLQNPVGMVGTRLEMDAHVITGSQGLVSTLDRAVRMAGYRPEPLIFAPCGTARYLLEDDDRQRGCLLIDIGGESTQYALIHRGRMRHSGVVPVGGNHVTRDIAYALSIGPEQAEERKRRAGVALRSGAQTRSLGDDGSNTQERETLAAVCEARLSELLELVANGLQWGISRPSLTAGIVLTGGGSRLAGTAELAEQIFALRAATRRAPGDDYGAEPDSWATVLGLVEYALEHESAIVTDHAVIGEGRIWSSMKRWIGRIV